jgi:hypothetical protein
MKTTIEIRRERILNIFGTDSPPLWLVRQKRDKYLARLKNRLVRILERDETDKWKLIVCNPKENISETEKPIAE